MFPHSASLCFLLHLPSARFSHLWVSRIRLQVLQELWAHFCHNTLHILFTWLVGWFCFFCLILNSLVDSAFLFFFSSLLIFSSNHVSTMRCLVCLWWAFQHSRLCFTTASISSMSLSLHVIVIKAGTHFLYRPTLIPSVAQIPRQ